MQDLFVDEVVIQYSYKGQGEKKKKPFKRLLLKECIFSKKFVKLVFFLVLFLKRNFNFIHKFVNFIDAAHLFSPNATDEVIKKQISTWLVGAALRLKRKT